MIDPALLGALVVLALVDSTSFGTLLIPVWLLMTPGRIRLGRVLAFLGTVVGAYFVIGLALMLGASAFMDTYGGVWETEPFLLGQLVVGLALLVISQLMDTKKARLRAAERAASGDGRLATWRARVMGDGAARPGSATALMGLALVAVAVELGSMLPYLAAIGLITAQELDRPLDGLLLAGYCLVMVTPALVLTAGRIMARTALEKPLSKLDQWLTEHAQATTAWIIGIVGFILAARAVFDLGWVGG